MRNWINTVSRDHVERGVRGRFTQANHGKPNMLRKMARGDWIIFYSPKTVHPDGEPLQAFTAPSGKSLTTSPIRPRCVRTFSRGGATSTASTAARRLSAL